MSTIPTALEGSSANWRQISARGGGGDSQRLLLPERSGVRAGAGAGAGGGVSNRQLLKFLKRLKHFLEAGVRVPALQLEVSEAVVVVFFQS